MTFDEFISQPTPQQEKYHTMLRLLPKFAVGKSNGRTIGEMCQFLSEHAEEFRGMTGDQVNRLYKYVKTKYASRLQELENSISKPAVQRNWESAFVGQSHSAAIPAPAPITAPAVPVVEEPKPAPDNQAPIEVAKPAEKLPPAKPGDAEAVRKHLSMSPAEMHRAASEANAKLKLLAKECGEWSKAKGYWGTRQKEAGEVVREWMYAEPGRREMIQDLARAALRVSGSKWAEAEVISDKRLEIVVASAGYRLAHENAIYAAEHPGWVPAVAA
jgi:hypothetical protein